MPDDIKNILESILTEVRSLREQASRPVKEWLTVAELADHLGVSPKTIRNQLSKKKFPIKHRKVGGKVLFRAKDIESLPVEA
jgi:excisionase family DNA binding protein